MWGHNLSILVKMGLTDLPEFGGVVSPLSPSLTSGIPERSFLTVAFQLNRAVRSINLFKYIFLLDFPKSEAENFFFAPMR